MQIFHAQEKKMFPVCDQCGTVGKILHVHGQPNRNFRLPATFSTCPHDWVTLMSYFVNVGVLIRHINRNC